MQKTKVPVMKKVLPYPFSVIWKTTPCHDCCKSNTYPIAKQNIRCFLIMKKQTITTVIKQ